MYELLTKPNVNNKMLVTSKELSFFYLLTQIFSPSTFPQFPKTFEFSYKSLFLVPEIKVEPELEKKITFAFINPNSYRVIITQN